MDLSKYDLPEEVRAEIEAQHNSSTEGLRKKNEELLGEKKAIQGSAAEQEKALEDARKAAVTAEEQKLVAEGKYKEALELREKENAELTAKANEQAETAKNALLSRDKATVLNQALGLIHDKFKGVSEAMLSNMLKVSYNDQQQPVTTFEHNGKVVANSIDEFKGWAGEQDQFKAILNGVDSSGANTQQSRASGSLANKPYSELTLTERAKLNNQ